MVKGTARHRPGTGPSDPPQSEPFPDGMIDYGYPRMLRKVLRNLLPLILAFYLTGSSLTQPRPIRFPEDQPAVFIQPIVMLDGNGARRLDILYGIPTDFFIYTRDGGSLPGSPFTAKGDITVEVFDSVLNSVARKIVQREIDVAQPPAPGSRGESITGLLSFDITARLHRIFFELIDTKSNRRYADSSKRVTVTDSPDGTINLGGMLFFKPTSVERGGQVIPVSLGGDVPFGLTFGTLFELSTTAPPESIIATWSINGLSSQTDSLAIIAEGIVPAASILRGIKILPSPDAAGGAAYRLTATDDTTRYVAYLPPQGTQFVEGIHTLSVTIRSGPSVVTAVQRFSSRWIDKPKSLLSLRSAIDALVYIMSENEYSRLKSAGPEEQKRLFATFWKARDKTPETAFNEWEDEYYRRVDHAEIAFRTLKQPNGFKTDRGKAYIFYGQPTSVSRSLSSSSASREIWIYENLGKKLIFTDEHRTGDYTLTGIEQ